MISLTSHGVRILAPYAALVVMAMGSRACDTARQRAIGAAEQRAHVAESTLVVVRRDSARLVAAARTVQEALRRDLERWQAMKERVRLVERWDTLPPDTVPGPERVVTVTETRPPTVTEIIAAADTTIRRCTIALDGCEARVANAERLAQLYREERDAYRVLLPTAGQRARGAITWAGAGAVACYLFCPRR